MENTKPVIVSTDEMEDSPEDNDDCRNAVQDDSEESNLTHGNQVLLSVPEQTFENQQLLSGISPQKSLPSVPTSTSSSQALNSDQLDEIFSSKDVFYSSRKLRIRTNCSRSVDAVLTNLQHLTACNYHSQESGRNITVLENQVLPSLGQETPENQQKERCSRPSVPANLSSSQIQDIDQLDEALSNEDVFYSSRDLRIRTNCSRNLDALLSPRQNRLCREDIRLSPRRSLTTSFTPMFEQSDVSSDKIDRRDRSPLGECRDTEMASPSELSTVRITRSLSKKLNRKKALTPSPKKLSVEKCMRSTTAKRRRTESSGSDSGQCGAKNESFRSKELPSVATRTLDMSLITVRTRETKAFTLEGNKSESLTRAETPKKRKREILESSCSGSNDALESNSSFLALAAKTDLKLPSDLQTLDSKEVRNLGESESSTEGRTSIFSRDYSTDSNSGNRSTPDLQSTEEHKTTLHSNIFTDVSLYSPNRKSGKRSETSSPSNRWIVVSPDSSKKEPVSLKLKFIAIDEASSNLEQTSNIRISETKDSQPCAEFSDSPEATQLTSDMAHSTTEIEMLESSQSRPITENPDSPSKVFDSGMEMQEFITCPSSVFSNSEMSEQSSSEALYIPHQVLECESFSEKGVTDRNRSDSSTPVSEPNVTSGSKSKKSSISTSLGMLQRSRKFSEIQDPNIPMQEHHKEPFLQTQQSDSISIGASRSRERSEVGMDLDAPYLDVHEGQPSTSSYQPVIADDSSTGDRFNSSSGVAASGDAAGRTIESNTSSNRISKHVSNAQKLLLTVLEEIMNFNEDENLYRRFSKLFHRISKCFCQETEVNLMLELMFYLELRETNWQVKSLFCPVETPEYHAQSAYHSLIRRVLVTLASTVSVDASMNVYIIKAEYKKMKHLYKRCVQFSRHDNEDKQDENSTSHVGVLKEMIQRLLLQTRNAFREFLMHIGEHAESRSIDSFEKILWDEDKCFLRRRFL